MEVRLLTYALDGIEAIPFTLRIGTGEPVDKRYVAICRNAGFSVDEGFLPVQMSLSVTGQAVVIQGHRAG